jgi:hypothetical protein
MYRLRRLTLPSASIPPSATALPETAGPACTIRRLYYSTGMADLLKKTNGWFSEALYVIRRYAMKLRGFREDIREITSAGAHEDIC